MAVFWYLLRRMDDQPPMLPLLTIFLSGHDAPCPSCGYNLHGLLTSRCPECHQELHLTVGLVEPRMRLWLTAVVAMAFGAGFNFLLLVYIVLTANKASRLLDLFLIHNAVGLLVQGIGLVVLLRWGRHIRRSSVGVRFALCLLSALLTIVNVIILSNSTG